MEFGERESQEGNSRSLVDEIRHRYFKDPEAQIGAHLQVEEQRLKELSADEFEEYVRLCTHLEATATIGNIFDTIADRFATDIKEYSTLPYPQRGRAMEIGDSIRTAIWYLACDPGITVSSDSIQKLYDNSKSEDRLVAHHAYEYIHNLIVLDSRNIKSGDSVGLFDQYKQDTVNALIETEREGSEEQAQRLIDVAWAAFPSVIEELMIQGFQEAETIESRERIWSTCCNRLGLGNARKMLRAYADVHPEFEEKLKKAEEAIAIDNSETVFADLRDLYDRVNFKDYKPNIEQVDQERDLLLENIRGKKRVLDIGAGTGRLMHALKEKGVPVFGFDYVKSHAQLIKDTDPTSEISVASWNNMPFKDGVFDAAYCFGRSVLHNTTVEDMLQFFRETYRVVSADGVVMIDIPDAEKGVYLEARNKVTEAAEKLGIQYLEDGLIHDSPDGKNFFDRLAPGREQFAAIAGIAGFNAEIIQEKDYKDAEGVINTNLYWKLTKKEKKPDAMEIIDLMHQAYTSSPPVTLTWL